MLLARAILCFSYNKFIQPDMLLTQFRLSTLLKGTMAAL
uniref:Uncharacterized protein n=1 Tax=Anguilla anguilla TaxID=7936 RepID=A0A0E9WRC1_ANGAN